VNSIMKLNFGILAFVLCIKSLSSEAIAVADLKEGLPLGVHLRIFEDKFGTARFEDIIAGKHDSDFKAQVKAVPNFGSTRSVIWAQVDLEFAGTTRDCLLELSHPVLDYVDVFVQDLKSGNIANSWQTGDLRPFDSRPINHRNFLFPLHGAGAVRVFLKVKSESSVAIPLMLWSERSFNEKDANKLLFLGIYYGLIAVMIIYNLITAYALRTLSGFIYVFYMLFLLIFQTILDGVFYGIFPTLTFWNNLGIAFWGNLASIFAATFSMQYLQTKKNAPILHKGLTALTIIVGLGALLTPFLGYYFGSLVNRFVAGTTGPILIITAGVVRLQQGYRPARFFLLGYGLFLISVILYTLGRFGLIPGANPFIYNAMHFGSALEAILLSFGLADRIRLIQKEKELAQAATIEQQKILNAAFARFVPAPFLQILGKKSIPEVLLGDYTEREMTILFADIRGFTTISEKLSPKQTFEFINNYLQGSGPVIRNNGGFIDKYMGDGIMALFEKREDAIRAALRLQERNARLNKSLTGRLVAPLNVGIGIHTGHLMLGTIGEHQRMDGTVISDAVNLASRVESLTKQYGVDLLVTKETLAGMKLGTTERPYLRRFIDRIAVKGKSDPATIYELIPLKAGTNAKYAADWLSKWVSAIKLYYSGQFSVAKLKFAELLEALPADKTALKFLERCEMHIAKPPEADWTGVAIATSK